MEETFVPSHFDYKMFVLNLSPSCSPSPSETTAQKYCYSKCSQFSLLADIIYQEKRNIFYIKSNTT